ncbi:MAG: hypothetical protein HC910_08080 [Spirulinaceae cyanobacterium SM2_1_0]|nr:hypothetical protein [Spirulinaceae cyanobacterium SM2_1_0]
MRTDKPVPRRFPKVPFERRFSAFLIDFSAVWLCSSFVGTGFWHGLVFALLWLVLRVVVVEKNRGQSLGAWCMDMKIIDLRFRKLPDLLTLTKREAVVGLGALLVAIGLNQFFLNPFSALLLASPLLVDCGIAYSDEQYNQALHDRFVGTAVLQTQRGISLDLRVRRWLNLLVENLRYRMRR